MKEEEDDGGVISGPRPSCGRPLVTGINQTPRAPYKYAEPFNIT